MYINFNMQLYLSLIMFLVFECLRNSFYRNYCILWNSSFWNDILIGRVVTLSSELVNEKNWYDDGKLL